MGISSERDSARDERITKEEEEKERKQADWRIVKAAKQKKERRVQDAKAFLIFY